MELNFRILHTSGKTQNKLIDVQGAESAKYIADILVPVCTEMRKKDATVAKIQVNLPGYDLPYTWIGNAKKEHMDAIAKSEKEAKH